MNDDVLKREIEEALAVEPSPEFTARLRQHIAQESAKRLGRWSWKIWTPGLAMAGLLLALLMYRPATTPIEPLKTAASATKVEVEEPSARAPILQAPSRRVVDAGTRKPHQASARKVPAEPEVLIDPRETVALQNFLDRIDERKIDPSMLSALFAAAERSQSAVIEPMPVAGLEPIEVQPLTASAPEKEGGSL